MVTAIAAMQLSYDINYIAETPLAKPFQIRSLSPLLLSSWVQRDAPYGLAA